jgi:serine/threonine protein kinase
VRLGKIKATGDVVAIKSVNKDQIEKLGKQRHIFREKDLLNEMNHPFIIKLIATTLVRLS